MEEKEIGEVSTYFKNVGVAAIKLSDRLSVGQEIHIKGNTTDFKTEVEEIQINRVSMPEAEKGEHVGIPVPEKVRPRDKVYLAE